VSIEHFSAGFALNVFKSNRFELPGLRRVLRGHAACAAPRGAHGFEGVDHGLGPRRITKYTGGEAHRVRFYRAPKALIGPTFGEKGLDWRRHRLYFYGIYESALGL
jgi:hypothetical protein